MLKHIPISKAIHGQHCTPSVIPTGYMFNREYIITSGWSKIAKMQSLGRTFLNIDETFTPIGPSHTNDIAVLKKHFPADNNLYHPIMVSGFDNYNIDKPSIERINRITKALKSVTFPFDGLSLVDLGSCLGYLTFTFESYGFQTTGVEHNTVYLSAVEHIKHILSSSAQFIENDIPTFIDTCDNYDIIVAANVLHHVINRGDTSEEVIRHLAKLTNLVLIVSYPLDIVRHSREPAIDLKQWGGFSEVLTTKQLPHTHPMWICIK